jgi:glutaminyl-tRNA synthetase
MYEHLFTRPDPGTEGDLIDDINPYSLTTLTGCKLEPLMADNAVGDAVQFERNGYFATDPNSTPKHLVFNQTMAMRDSWAKIQAKDKSGGK